MADLTAQQAALFTDTSGATTASNTRVGVTNASTQLLAANTLRVFAIIENNSGSTVFIKFGAAAVANQGFWLTNGSQITIEQPSLWLGTVNAIKSGGGTATVDVFEGTP